MSEPYKTLRYAILANVKIINMRSHSKFGTPVVHFTVGQRWASLVSSLSVRHRLKVAYLIEFFFIRELSIPLRCCLREI